MPKAIKPKPTQIVQAFMKEIRTVDHSPRFQTIITNGFLELLVNTLIEHRCKHGTRIIKGTRDYPYSVKLVLLNELGLIPDYYYTLLDGFRHLRNEAAHESHFFLTPENLAPFKDARASDGATQLGDPKNYRILCLELFLGFWNLHVKLFAPTFEPHLFTKCKDS